MHVTNTRGFASVLLVGTLAALLAALVVAPAPLGRSATYTAPVELVAPYVVDVSTALQEANCGFCEVCSTGSTGERKTMHMDIATSNSGYKYGHAGCSDSPPGTGVPANCHGNCGSALAPVLDELNAALLAALHGDFTLAREAAVRHPELATINLATGTFDVSHPCLDGVLFGRVTLPATASS